MADLFTVENLITLALLTLLQAVLGFDNLLYISLESKNAPEEKRRMVRNVGIGLAILLRIGLLFLLVSMIGKFQEPILGVHWSTFLEGSFNIHKFNLAYIL
ncbi:MAG: tellurium resistance protein TerC, partial [Bacteroidetes bacterium]|nr:tellurium resistance protein TerC [Bacteroidota bacterium]